VGTGVWAAKNDKRWVVNLSAVFGIIAIFSQLFSFEFHPLSILIVGLTSLGLAFAMVRYNKHATSPADPKTARTPAKSYESMPARVKTAEVPGFADAGDSVTMPQQDQVVQEKAVEQQPASANASNSPAKKKKIILWACIGGGATLLVVGLLIWLLGDDEAVQDAQEKKAEASPQSNQSPAPPPRCEDRSGGKD
jgi:flagellar basal body-associated protein FliL